MRNLPPASGRLVASPEQGYAQDTLFTLSAESWVDPPIPQDDYPLTYSFGYYHPSGSIRYLAVSVHTSQVSTPMHNTLHNTHYTLHTTHYTLHTTHYTLHTTHYTLYTTHYTLHTIHYTLHTPH